MLPRVSFAQSTFIILDIHTWEFIYSCNMNLLTRNFSISSSSFEQEKWGHKYNIYLELPSLTSSSFTFSLRVWGSNSKLSFYHQISFRLFLPNVCSAPGTEATNISGTIPDTQECSVMQKWLWSNQIRKSTFLRVERGEICFQIFK